MLRLLALLCATPARGQAWWFSSDCTRHLAANGRGHDCNFDGVSASGSDLRGADFTGASFRGADLRGALLDGAALDRADFSGARLDGASLRKAVMRGTIFSDASLVSADLSEANGAGEGGFNTAGQPQYVNFRGSDCTFATFYKTALKCADFTGALMLAAELDEVRPAERPCTHHQQSTTHTQPPPPLPPRTRSTSTARRCGTSTSRRRSCTARACRTTTRPERSSTWPTCRTFTLWALF